MHGIDEQIRKAMEEGQFDNLPGKGKPIDLNDNPHEAPEWRMANHLLKNSGFTLPWIEARQEIENLLATQRQALERAWTWRKAALERKQGYDFVESEWQRAVQAFRQQVTDLNQKIRDYNLQTPSERFQLLRVNADAEIEAITQV